MKTSAVVLAAGSGSRMGTSTKKQFIELLGYPILYYSLKTFENSFIDEIVLVVSCEDEDYVRESIISLYGFSKVKAIAYGGKERYNSVLNGLKKCSADTDYVFIHDCARPMLTEEILDRGLECVRKCDACVVGMPSKDTVKIASRDGVIASTPDRSLVWNIQTPQIFKYDLILPAYKDILSREDELKKQGVNITDDAMILEHYSGHPVRLVEGSYENIKVTTPEDLKIAEGFLTK